MLPLFLSGIPPAIPLVCFDNCLVKYHLLTEDEVRFNRFSDGEDDDLAGIADSDDTAGGSLGEDDVVRDIVGDDGGPEQAGGGECVAEAGASTADFEASFLFGVAGLVQRTVSGGGGGVGGGGVAVGGGASLGQTTRVIGKISSDLDGGHVAAALAIQVLHPSIRDRDRQARLGSEGPASEHRGARFGLRRLDGRAACPSVRRCRV